MPRGNATKPSGVFARRSQSGPCAASVCAAPSPFVARAPRSGFALPGVAAAGPGRSRCRWFARRVRGGPRRGTNRRRPRPDDSSALNDDGRPNIRARDLRIVVADVDVVATRALEALARRPGAIAFARARLPRMAARGVLPASWSASHRRGPQREGGTADARGPPGQPPQPEIAPRRRTNCRGVARLSRLRAANAPRVVDHDPAAVVPFRRSRVDLEKRQNWITFRAPLKRLCSIARRALGLQRRRASWRGSTEARSRSPGAHPREGRAALGRTLV